jgi:antitoxin component YwqK of YwqJK toxin-antitoxin module
MKFFYLFLLSVLTQSLFAQGVKTYLTIDGSYTDNPAKAFSYIIFEKAQDSSYLMQQFDLQDVIMMQGFYKNRSLNFPNGKFDYYKKQKIDTDLVAHTATYENFVQSTGVYINGLQEGIWIEYLSNDIKYSTSTFKNGKLNGIYQKYDARSNNHVVEARNYIDNKREGEWKTYDIVNDVVLGEVYHNDILINTICYKKDIQTPNDFYKTISIINNDYKNNELKISFEVDTDGHVGNFIFDKKLSDSHKKFITAAIINSGNFIPALLNAKSIKGVYSLTINKYSSELEHAAQQKQSDIIGRHANDIGRGLNQAGIGKPLNY